MSRGRRYESESKINIKKILAVIVVILVAIMFVAVIKILLNQSKETRVSSENYFTAYTNNKYGVINSNGEVIIEPSYAEYIVIPNPKKDIFLCTYDVNYSTGEYKTKALNKNNEDIFTEYEQIEALENYDKNNNLYYEGAAIRVKKNGKYGLINLEGKEILPTEYDEIETLKGLENSILVYKDGRVGLVDSKSKKIIDTEYVDILAIEDDYKLGYITVNENNQYGLVDCNNLKILDNKYEQIAPISGNGNYVVKENGKYKLIAKDGTTLIEDKFDEVKEIKNDYIIIKLNNKYGVLNTAGEEIVPARYDDIKFSFNDTYIVKENNQYMLINKSGEPLLDKKYQTMNYIEEADIIEASEDGIYSDIITNDSTVKLTGIVLEINTKLGYIRINIDDEYKYYNFKMEQKTNTEILSTNTLFLIKKDGKYGYTDKAGNIVVECIYDEATEQNQYGYVAVKIGKEWGSLDKTGKVVAEINRQLENNPLIDFIGEWNLTEDINMNCYTK